MKYQSVLVSALMFAGCKDYSSNTGDVEVDFIADTANDLIGDKWDNEEQKKKYASMVDYRGEECHSRMKKAWNRFMSNTKAQENLPAEEKDALVQVKAHPELHEKFLELMAKGSCNKIAAMKNVSPVHNEPPTTDQIALDLAIDSMDEEFTGQKGWRDEAQKAKYSEMAGLKKEVCEARVSAGIEKILQSPDLQAKLKDGCSAKDKIESLKKLNVAERKTKIKELAKYGCSQLSSFKETEQYYQL